jgi:hypothetical protein
MQVSRILWPAAIAVLIHGMVLVGLLNLTRTPLRPDEHAMEIVRVPAPASTAPSYTPSAPGAAHFALSPRLFPHITHLPAVPRAPSSDPALSILGDYVACGVGRMRSQDEQAACDKMRAELVAGPTSGDKQDVLAQGLEKRFAREKAIQEAPVLLPCFTPAGPNLLCFIGGALNGFSFATGSYASSGPLENPLAQPIFPYRAK